MTRTIANLEPFPQSFQELNALHALRPIQDQSDLENARQVVDALAVMRERNKDQDDYLETPLNPDRKVRGRRSRR